MNLYLPAKRKYTLAQEEFYVKSFYHLKSKYPSQSIDVIAKGLKINRNTLYRWVNIRGGMEGLKQRYEKTAGS